MSYFKVETSGQTLVVNITNNAGTAVTTYTDSGLGTPHTLPKKITSDTEFHFAAVKDRKPHILKVTTQDGTVLYSKTVEPNPNAPHIVGPVPTAAQAAAAARRRDLALAPTGALAETFPRMGAAGTSQTAAASGTLHMSAIYLPENTVVSSISYMSGSTAGVTLTHQWFALYDSDLALIAQTADDTNTAWGGQAVKTLAFASPVTTTYSGLHYVGFLVTAATVPTFLGYTSYTHAVAPITCGTSTTGLTDTAPATAAALTAASNTAYAYVS